MTVVRVDVRILSHFGHFKEFAELREGAGLLEEEIETVFVPLALSCGCVTVCALRWAGDHWLLCLFQLLFFYPDHLSSPLPFLLSLHLFIT